MSPRSPSLCQEHAPLFVLQLRSAVPQKGVKEPQKAGCRQGQLVRRVELTQWVEHMLVSQPKGRDYWG